MTTFFTADHHFGHARIIALSRRPFRDLDEMTAALVTRWNDAVRPEDTVWHLGDFVFGGKAEGAALFERLNGRKHLVVGNHDTNHTLKLPWASVSQMVETKVEGQRVVLCHYPFLEWPGFYRGVPHLFGHVHGTKAGLGHSLDVGVDCWNFRPVSFAEILAALPPPPERPVRDEG